MKENIFKRLIAYALKSERASVRCHNRRIFGFGVNLVSNGVYRE